MDPEDKRKLISSILLSVGAVALLWVIHLILWFFEIDKTLLANIPRLPLGAIGILTSPLVHDDFAHLAANSGPLLMFLAATLYFYRKAIWGALFGIWVFSGVLVWLGAHSGAHIGASGVVYGLGAFGFFSGVFRRDVRSISLSLLIALLGGSMVWGVFPGQQGVSWESHLFGALAGVTMAWAFRKTDRIPRRRYGWEDEPEQDPNDANAVWNYRQNWPGSQNYYSSEDSKPSDLPPNP